jgi:hypothetical protein
LAPEQRDLLSDLDYFLLKIDLRPDQILQSLFKKIQVLVVFRHKFYKKCRAVVFAKKAV